MRSLLIRLVTPIYGLRSLLLRLLVKLRRHERPAPERPTAAQRVLVLRLDEVGDVLLSGPFVRGLRAGLPNAHITLAVSPTSRPLVELCPYVDDVLTYPKGPVERLQLLGGLVRARRFALKHLRSRAFDLALVPRWDSDTYQATFLAYWSGARRRVGFSEKVTEPKSVRNRGFDRLLTDVLEAPASMHEAERSMRVLDWLGLDGGDVTLELWADPEDIAAADEILALHGVADTDVLVALGVGGRHPKRLWPPDRLAEVASLLRDHCGARAVVVGGPGEEGLGQEIATALGPTAIDAVGRLGLRGSGALLRRCALYVGNDSGSMHLAAAAGTPVVELSCHPIGAPDWHPNSPVRFGPWGVPATVLRPRPASPTCVDGCTARRAHCILGLHVTEVSEAAAAHLSQTLSTGLLDAEVKRTMAPHGTRSGA